MYVRISLFAIAALLLAAHFFRAGHFLLVALSLATPLLFLYKKRWSLILLQLAAFGASATWLRAAFELVELRQQADRSWIAAAVILGAVALFTLVAGLLLNSRRLLKRYPLQSLRPCQRLHCGSEPGPQPDVWRAEPAPAGDQQSGA